MWRGADHPEVRGHVAVCQSCHCPCHLYWKNSASWAKELVADPAQPSGGSWLHHRIVEGKFRCLCVVCKVHLPGHFASLKRHHNSAAHNKRVAALLGKPIAEGAFTAPPVEAFRDVLRAFRQGTAAVGGFQLQAGHVCQKKGTSMLWCLGEALAERTRKAISESTVLCLMRDERHGRLHIRFRAVTAQLEVKSGYLGQHVGHSQDSLSILQATSDICRKACTINSSPTAGSSLAEVFDASLFAHLREILEAISVDSASNEVTAVADMTSSLHPNTPQFAPNCKHLLRDSAHSARRLLERLWRADKAPYSVHGRASACVCTHACADGARLHVSACVRACMWRGGGVRCG